MSKTEDLEFFYQTLDDAYSLGTTVSLLRWDEKVFMPRLGAAGRAKQIALLSTLVHERLTDEKFVQVVKALSADQTNLTKDQQVDLRETTRSIDRESKLSSSFVREKEELVSLTHASWLEAKKGKDFSLVKDNLKKLLSLLRQEVSLVGYQGSPYNALFEKYEPFMTFEEAMPLLEKLSNSLQEIIPQVLEKQKSVSALDRRLDVSLQEQMGRRIAIALGYSFDLGRLDPTAHPFKTSIGPSDVRICTRYDESDYSYSLYSTIHEVGHALYSLGLPKEQISRPRGTAISLSIHESQSRLWENVVGRSKPFVNWLYESEKEIFKNKLAVQSSDDLWTDLNLVSNSLKRVEADELTYSLHIYIRSLLEEKLVCGDLEVEDLPAAWNELYKKYLGVVPRNDTEGLLQDIHWYKGSIGYFPTYALGNMFAAQMMEVANKELGSLDNEFEKGDFSKLLSWLNKNVHEHGMLYGSSELIEKISGKTLSMEPFTTYLKNKFLS